MADTGIVQPVISDGYRKMQESLHEDPNYGVASKQYASLVADIIEATGVGEILDYGAGKGRLRESIAEFIQSPVEISEYDPALPDKSDTPEPSDLVICIDVLEHIEPSLLDNVLDDLKRVTKAYGLFTIHTGKAAKHLPDGRNAHLIQEPMEWWLPKLMDRFLIHSLARVDNGFWVIVRCQ